MIVVDSGVIANLYFNGEHSVQAEQLLAIDADWAAPQVWRGEFRNLVLHYMARSVLAPNAAVTVLKEAEALMMDREYEIPFYQVIRLGETAGLSAYEVEYVALAQYLGVPLVTINPRVLKEFPKLSKALDEFILQHR